MIEQKKRRTTRVARMLTDPKPEFVSLVSNGANQTPFMVVKADKVKPEIVELTEDSNMTRKRTNPNASETTAKADGESVQKASALSKAVLVDITFDRNVFKSQESVLEWLTAKGYEVDKLFVEEGTYVAKNDETPEGEAKELVVDNGVTVHAVTVAKEGEEEGAGEGEEAAAPATEGAAKEEPAKEEEAAKAAEPAKEEPKKEEAAADPTAGMDATQKFDWYMAAVSNEGSLEGVFGDANDGLPPGIGELNSAFFTVLRNNTKKGDMAGVRKAASDFADFYVKLAETFMGAAGTEAKKTETQAPIDMAALLSGLTGAFTTGVNALKDTLVASQKTMLEEVTKSVGQQIQDSVKEVGERVTSLENVSQTRKGEDTDIVKEQPKVTTQKGDDFDNRMFRAGLGISA